MKKFMMFILIAVFSVAVLCAGGVKKAEALMMVRTELVGTGDVEFTDNVAGFTLLSGAIIAATGDTGISGGVAGVMTTETAFTLISSITTTTDKGYPVLGTTATPIMDMLAGVDGAGTFVVTMSNTDFTANSFPGFGIDFGGSHAGAGSLTSISISLYGGTSNSFFDLTNLLGTAGPESSDPFAATSSTGPLTSLSNYSLTMVATVVQTGGTTTFNADFAPVPEPGTIALLGIGLAGLVGVGVRRRAKKNAQLK